MGRIQHRTGGLIALLVGPALLPAQATIVSGGGTALQNAINGAAAGDTLDVQPGTYTPVTCSVGLRILLRPGAEIRDPASVPVVALTVTGIPAGQTFQVDGGQASGVSVTNCAGRVVANRIGMAFSGNTAMQIAACSGPVVFDDVDFPFVSIYSTGQLDPLRCLHRKLDPPLPRARHPATMRIRCSTARSSSP